MQLIRMIEATKNYTINLYEYWATTVSAIVTTYGIVNKNTGVVEIGPIQSLADARHFQRELEKATYPEPVDTGNESLDTTMEVKPH